ncbi:MAG: DUF177 domain-containing protein [Ardenticatenales bacterium]|nr:DUF177 domain-containing protein [Ardenticatenales bacterium]
MQFNVAQLLKEPTGGTRKYEIDETLDDLDPELVIQEPITGKIKFTKIPQGILMVGKLRTLLEMNCSRCLEPFDLPVTIKLEEQFRPLLDLQTGAVLPQEEDADEATLIDQKNIVDLSEVVRQALLLVLPALPVCREDCLGLCAQCGQNLNEGTCDCPQEIVDPRWEALRTLLDSPEEDSEEES